MAREPETGEHVLRAVAGDEASIDWLVGRFSPALYAQAHYRMGALLRRTVEPADLVQEVWAIALSKLGEFDVERTHRGPALVQFLGRILVYRINQLLRASIVRHTKDAEQLIDPRRHGVVTSVIRREDVGQAMLAVRALSEEDREILVLRVLEQRSAKDVAAQLGVTEAVVYTRQHRALKEVRSRLPSSVFDELARAKER